jgi:hypothetical protein
MATVRERDREPRRFMRLTIPMCLNDRFGTLEPTTGVMGTRCHHSYSSHALGGEDGTAGAVAGVNVDARTSTRNYVVERLQSCVYGRLCRR